MSKKNIVLKDIRKTYTIELPSFKGSEVVLYDGILFGNAIDIQALKDDVEKGIATTVSMIKDWNFTDENEKVLEITEENIKMLPADDINFLMETVNSRIEKKKEDQKKS